MHQQSTPTGRTVIRKDRQRLAETHLLTATRTLLLLKPVAEMLEKVNWPPFVDAVPVLPVPVL